MVLEVLTECRWTLYDFEPPAEILRLSRWMAEAAATPDAPEHFKGEALIALIVDQLRAGDIQQAKATIEEHRRRTNRSNHGLMPWLQATLDNLGDLWHGHLESAQQRLYGLSKELLDQIGSARTGDSLWQTWMGQVFWLRREQGSMAELANEGVEKLAEQRAYFPIWMSAMALLHSQTGRPDAVMDVFRALFDQTDDLRALPPHGWSTTVLALIAEAADGLVRTGYRSTELTEFCVRTEDLLRPHHGEVVLAGWPTVLMRPVALSRALLALALEDGEAALPYLDDCARQVSAAPLQLGWYRFHRARALEKSDPETARTLLRQALTVAETHGLSALREAVGLLSED